MKASKGERVTRPDLERAYRQALAGELGQIVAALYSYGARLVDERRAERDKAPGARRAVTVPTSGSEALTERL